MLQNVDNKVIALCGMTTTSGRCSATHWTLAIGRSPYWHVPPRQYWIQQPRGTLWQVRSSCPLNCPSNPPEAWTFLDEFGDISHSTLRLKLTNVANHKRTWSDYRHKAFASVQTRTWKLYQCLREFTIFWSQGWLYGDFYMTHLIPFQWCLFKRKPTWQVSLIPRLQMESPSSWPSATRLARAP